MRLLTQSFLVPLKYQIALQMVDSLSRFRGMIVWRVLRGPCRDVAIVPVLGFITNLSAHIEPRSIGDPGRHILYRHRLAIYFSAPYRRALRKNFRRDRINWMPPPYFQSNDLALFYKLRAVVGGRGHRASVRILKL